MNSEYLTKWEHPSDYGGFSPDDDYVILSRNRDSQILENSNYTRALEMLEAIADKHDVPEDGEPWVYDFRAGHWAVGWVEYIIVRQDAPDDVIREAEEIVCALADYPVLDESHYSEMQYQEISDYWERCSMSEKIEWCKDSGESIFYARHSIPDSLYQSEMFF